MTKDNVAALETNSANKKFKQKKYTKPRQNQRAPTQIESQLSALFNLTIGREGRLREIEQLGVEGEDHINLSRASATQLGFLLSPNTKTGFNLYGKNFSSVENLMLYYRAHCTNAAIATADPNACFQFRKDEVTKFPHFNNIFVVVCLAYVSIFKKFPALKAAMSENTIPFDAYRMKNNKRERLNTAKILIRAISEAHASVVENREPNIQVFLNRDSLEVVTNVYNDMPYNEKLSLNGFIKNCFDPNVIARDYREAHPEEEKEVVESEKPVAEAVNSSEEQATDLGDVIAQMQTEEFAQTPMDEQAIQEELPEPPVQQE